MRANLANSGKDSSAAESPPDRFPQQYGASNQSPGELDNDLFASPRFPPFVLRPPYACQYPSPTTAHPPNRSQHNASAITNPPPNTVQYSFSTTAHLPIASQQPSSLTSSPSPSTLQQSPMIVRSPKMVGQPSSLTAQLPANTLRHTLITAYPLDKSQQPSILTAKPPMNTIQLSTFAQPPPSTFQRQYPPVNPQQYSQYGNVWSDQHDCAQVSSSNTFLEMLHSTPNLLQPLISLKQHPAGNMDC